MKVCILFGPPNTAILPFAGMPVMAATFATSARRVKPSSPSSSSSSAAAASLIGCFLLLALADVAFLLLALADVALADSAVLCALRKALLPEPDATARVVLEAPRPAAVMVFASPSHFGMAVLIDSRASTASSLPSSGFPLQMWLTSNSTLATIVRSLSQSAW